VFISRICIEICFMVFISAKIPIYVYSIFISFLFKLLNIFIIAV
jgi:hypothetical protein